MRGGGGATSKLAVSETKHPRPAPPPCSWVILNKSQSQPGFPTCGTWGSISCPAYLSLGVPNTKDSSLQWLSEGQTEASLSQRAEDGKTELSLMRFSLAHPQWQPPGHSSKFLGHLRGRVQQDAAAWGATSTRSPPTPGVLSDCTSPLVSPRPAYSFAPSCCPSLPGHS